MSSVRMCDRCGKVFSENAEGWQTFTASTMEYDDNGYQVAVPIRQDACPECAIKTPSRRKAKANETDQRIAALEADNEKLQKLTQQINEIGKEHAASA